MSKRIVMEGYYGRGNFGDDVLMQVTYRLLREEFPGAEIAIIATEPSQAYIVKLLDGISIIPPDRHAHSDIVVHGGGGVFFDFAHYGIGRKTGEALIRLIGFSAFLKLAALTRKLTGKDLPTTSCRIGLGIGVGTFTAGSPRMLKSLPILADFKALWVRDTHSIANLKPCTNIMNAEIIEGSDIAFLSEHWLPNAATRSANTKPKLGIVLRDWPQTDIHELRNSIARLIKDYDITGFIFDAKSDVLIRGILTQFPTHVWDPNAMNIADFAAQLAAQDVLLTSRAHGAICGACLGVPSVIVNIEPKMEQVHAMLPNSTVLVGNENWRDALKQASAIAPATIAADVTKNRIASQSAWAQMKRWFA